MSELQNGLGIANATVIGCGHVGVVTAAGLAKLGHRVAGYDIDACRIEALSAGQSPFWEPGLQELVAEGLASGNLRFSTSLEDALGSADAAFLCVNTPATPSGAADLHFVRDAIASLAAVLIRTHERPLVINKSTAPIGTAETIEFLLGRAFEGSGLEPPEVAANPEFLRQGTAVRDFFAPQRIVVGANSAEAAERVAALYRGIDAPVVATGIRAAELIKYAANSFLATRISFANELSRLCEALEIDVETVIDGIALDSRIGGAMFRPGIGYGGSCLPKDVAALRHTGECAGVPMRILEAVHEVNTTQKKHAVNVLRSIFGRLDGRTLAVWGATFKGGTEDLRDSPALDVAGLLRNEGARIRVFDPAVHDPLPLELADETCFDPVEVVRGADALLVLSDWPEFSAVAPGAVAVAMAGKVVIDGRNVLDPGAWAEAGLLYRGIGRRAIGVEA